MDRFGLIGLAALLSAGPALATEPEALPKSVVLDGPAIIALFEGKTLRGVYFDGTPVKETYEVGGAIPDYWDAQRTDTGQWSVVNNLLCTFYTSMAGGCFRVEKLSDNCFDFYGLADTVEEALRPGNKPNYTARVAIDGIKSTCPDNLQV